MCFNAKLVILNKPARALWKGMGAGMFVKNAFILGIVSPDCALSFPVLLLVFQPPLS